MLLRPASSRVTAPAVVAASAAGSVALVALVDPNQPGHYPGCPILAVSGYYCPGCGGLRAVHALAHGDVSAALDLNALIVLIVPFAVAGYLAWAWARLRGPRRKPAAAGRWVATVPVVAVAVCLAFGVLRNLPAFAVLAP